jgi:hypothetical protein
LNLSGNPISDSGMINLKKCDILSSLDLHDCQEITDSALDLLTAHHPLLQKINLLNCPKITKDGLSFLEKKGITYSY